MSELHGKVYSTVCKLDLLSFATFDAVTILVTEQFQLISVFDVILIFLNMRQQLEHYHQQVL